MGTKESNSIEIVEFLLNGNHYGINTNVVKEIVAYQQTTLVPNAHPSIEGVFMPRDKMITVINLRNCLQMGESSDKGFFIVTQLADMEVAFHIDSVAGIHKITTNDIMDVGFSAQEDGYTEGILKKDSRLIVVLDIAKIVRDVNPEITM